jgi:osomolarity two-component system response regulator SKN7
VEKHREGKSFDLILMDIIMPNLDGCSAAHFIRQNDSTTPIIAMTSNIRSDDIAAYYNHGLFPSHLLEHNLLILRSQV